MIFFEKYSVISLVICMVHLGVFSREPHMQSYNFLRHSLPFVRMKEAFGKKKDSFCAKLAQPSTINVTIANFFASVRNGTKKAIPHSSFGCDFYYLSDAKTDVYLMKAKSLINMYVKNHKTYTNWVKSNPRDLTGAALFKKQMIAINEKLANRMDEELLHAARECAKWIMPSLQQLKDDFHKIEKFRIFEWAIKSNGNIPIVIGEETQAITDVSSWLVSGIKVELASLRTIQVSGIKVELASLRTIQGCFYFDKDRLRGSIAHETHHLLVHDFIDMWHNDLLYGSEGDRKPREIAADAYACKFSKSSCVGYIKYFATSAKLSRETGKKENTTDHPSYSERLSQALMYAQEYWKLSPEECQTYILQGEERAKAMMSFF